MYDAVFRERKETENDSEASSDEEQAGTPLKVNRQVGKSFSTGQKQVEINLKEKPDMFAKLLVVTGIVNEMGGNKFGIEQFQKTKALVYVCSSGHEQRSYVTYLLVLANC